MNSRSRGNSGEIYYAFRRTFDDEFQRYTGSGYPRGDEFVRKQHSGGPIHGLTKSGGMGFRLAHDREET